VRRSPKADEYFFLGQVKGRILKHSGDMEGACEALEEGRALDLADKWINSKSAKYHLRLLDIENAENIAGLFTRFEGDTRGYLKEMQANWFEVEAARAFFEKNEIALSFKFYDAVETHFQDYIDDQLEFHGYCLRKGTLRAYLEFIRVEERIRGHPFYAKAASGMIECILAIVDFPHDHAEQLKAVAEDLPDKSGKHKEEQEKEATNVSTAPTDAERQMSAVEKKKAKQQARKAKKRQEQEQAKDDEDTKKKKQPHHPPDKDRKGHKITAQIVADPLRKACEVVAHLEEFSKGSLQSHLDSFDVHIRRGRLLLALRALLRGSKVVPEKAQHPEILRRLLPLIQFIESGKITYGPWIGACKSRVDEFKPVEPQAPLKMHEDVKSIALQIGKRLLGAESIIEKLQNYKAEHLKGSDLRCRKAAIFMSLLLENEANREVLFNSATADVPEGVSVFSQLNDFCNFLKRADASESVTSAFAAKAKERFPLAKFD